MAGKVERFMVNVNIIEGRHLAWPNMDSAVHVRVDNQRKCTAIVYNSESPFFSEYFAFEFFTTLQTLIDKNITLTVIQPGKVWRAKKTLGYVTLDMATVWAQSEHQFYHKWAVISAPADNPPGGPRGYIKVDINIVRRGEAPQNPPIETGETDEIEGNLLLPEGAPSERQKATYVIKIYRGENFCKEKYLDSKSAPPPEKDPPNSHIEVFFAGLQGKTSIRKTAIHPVWNESLRLTELFPPLCQRIKIHLCFNDVVVAVRHINLRAISNAGEHGFLPTFGPTFVCFYGKGTNNEGFIGKVLLSFRTDLQHNAFGVAKSVTLEKIPPLNEVNLWKNEAVLLYAIILDANLIDKGFCDKPISYELNFGNSELQLKINDGDDSLLANKTTGLTPLTNGKLYWYLEYGQEKPCLYFRSLWPDFRRRIFNSNKIAKIVDELKVRLSTIETLFINQERRTLGENPETLLLDAIDFFSSACRKYIDLSQGSSTVCQTELDVERTKLCLREMESIQKGLEHVYNEKLKKLSFMKIQKFLERLKQLIDDAQDCWPDVYITMISGAKKVAFFRCLSRDIVYSVIDEEKGKYCGLIQNIFLQPNCLDKPADLFSSEPCRTHSKISCKLSIFLWLGLERHKNACFQAFPTGFVPPKELALENLPRYLVAQEKHIFNCRAHLYQGKFVPGFDKSGLCDPFSRVILAGVCRETAVSSATLNPVWDQTLVYRKIVLYGTKSHIKTNPPCIIIEVFDQDEFSKVEFVGRCTLNPIIKFAEEPYRAPNFPPKLRWYDVTNRGEVLGAVLTVAEFFEASQDLDEEDLKPTKEIVRIPADIKPTMVQYRIEVIFWGVRDLQKIGVFSINKPKITIDCGSATLHSATILGVSKTLNFSQYNKQIDVVLPEEEEYAPPVCIKMFDCRSFGRNVLAGTHLVSLNHFLGRPVTSIERNRLIYEIKSTSWASIRSELETYPTITIDYDALKEEPPTAHESFWTRWLKCFLSSNKNSHPTNKRPNKSATTHNGTSVRDLERQKKTKPGKKLKRDKTTSDDESTSDSDLEPPQSSAKEAKKRKKLKKSGNTTDENPNFKYHQLPSHNKKNKRKKRGKSSSSGNASQSPKRRKSPGKRRKPKKSKKFTTASEDASSDIEILISDSESHSPKKRKKRRNKRKSSNEDTTSEGGCCCKLWLKDNNKSKKTKIHVKKKNKESDEELEADFDWWTKYYASVEQFDSKSGKGNKKKKSKRKSCSLKIYRNELEAQPEFEGFTDTLQTFQLYKGKRTGDETVDETNIKGIFKGAIKVYRWPQPDNSEYVTETGFPLTDGVFQNFPSNEPIRFVVRIYCVKGINLRPKDANGKSDPYVIITMNDKIINDKQNYVAKQINPVFGRCYEMVGVFPHNHAITVSVWDWDLASADDLIGETRIDIENRFYSRHRAHCGIASEYKEIGYSWWRDNEIPSEILQQLCKKSNISAPVYMETYVRVGPKAFSPVNFPTITRNDGVRTTFDKEVLALTALNRWQEIPLVGCTLVPEHVETRSLYHPAKPGVEQGKIQLWVDIFHATDLPPPRQVNIIPRKPVAYELRVIIWNTDDVILEEDDFFVGEKMSDIYVKGWLTGPNESQCTDVHYRSMTGEGNFNWRFVFPFKYLSSENKLVKSKKESLFSIDETEFKIPCRLYLQVWDNDTFSADDFLGVVSLELSHLPRGARSSGTCNLDNLASRAPTINLFKIRRTKGWWPFRGSDPETNDVILGGKVEVEFELVTSEDAAKNPVGLGRAAPQPLPPPNRPDTSFSWFKNPLLSLKFLICKHYRCKIIKCFIFVCLCLAIALAVYAVPGYSVKKLLGV